MSSLRFFSVSVIISSLWQSAVVRSDAMFSAILEYLMPIVTIPVLDRFYDSSKPPRKCAKSSESVPKPEKVWIITIFAVQMLFFCVQNKKFWVRSTNFCRLMAQVLLHYKLLPPYGASFAALWPSTNKQSAVQKSVAIF
jgi:hypothetical protein